MHELSQIEIRNNELTLLNIEWTENHKQVFGDIDIFPRKNYVKINVVRDENIITSLGNSFIDFTGEILDWYGEFDKENVLVRRKCLDT